MTPEMNQKENGLADLGFWIEQRITEIHAEINSMKRESKNISEYKQECIADYKKMITRWEAVQDALDLAVGMARREHWLLGYDDLDEYIKLEKKSA